MRECLFDGKDGITMKYIKRALSVLLAAMMLATMLTGCTMPKLFIGGTPKTVGTVGDYEVTTAEYLAYMYLAFTDVYFQQGLYQYAQYGLDAWEQELTYGEGDDAQKIMLEEFLHLSAQENLKRQVAIQSIMKDNGIEWNAEDVKGLEESFATMNEEEFLGIGIGRDTMINVYKNVSLNRSSLLKGLYGAGGKREVSEKDRKEYFDKNYVSYKTISIELTDDEGKELSADKKKEKIDLVNGYLADYNKSGNFEKVMDAYLAYQEEQTAAESDDDTATEKEEIEPTTDEDNRINADATNLDENLVKEIRATDIGKARVVEYKADGTTPTVALIVRLDPNDDADLFKSVTDAIISKMKGDEIDKEIDERLKTITTDFKDSALKKCDPKPFEEMVYG